MTNGEAKTCMPGTGAAACFVSADGQPELGLYDVKRAPARQCADVIRDLVFAARRQRQFNVEHLAWKDIRACVGQLPAIEIGFLNQLLQRSIDVEKGDAEL